MARIRTIKPEFFTSDTVTSLPIRARVTWIGLWTHCDDYGRCRDNVKLIKAAVWPLDGVSLRDIEEDLQALLALGLVFKYEAAGKSYIQVTGWTEHQKVDRPSRSPLPPPSSTGNGSYPQEDARERLASPREELDREGKGKEGKGRERAREASDETHPESARSPEPPPRCPKHLDNPTTDPCGPCGTARKTRAAWDANQAQQTRDAPRCKQHRGQPAHNCAPCRADQLATTERTTR